MVCQRRRARTHGDAARSGTLFSRARLFFSFARASGWLTGPARRARGMGGWGGPPRQDFARVGPVAAREGVGWPGKGLEQVPGAKLAFG